MSNDPFGEPVNFVKAISILLWIGTIGTIILLAAKGCGQV